MWFQQDGHSAYTEATRMLLNKKFDDHWIGPRSPHERPPTYTTRLLPVGSSLTANLRNAIR